MQGKKQTDEEIKRRIQVWESFGCNSERAAPELGISPRTLRDTVEEARNRGLLVYGPSAPTPPAGMVPSRMTVMDKQGEERLRWTQYKPEDSASELAMEAIAETFAKPLRGKYKPRKMPAVDTDEFMTGLPIGDMHIGSLSWGEETGTDWDLEKAQNILRQSVVDLLATMPATKTCWIWQLGDFYHVDSQHNTTFKGTQQDVDTRFAKVVRVGVDLIKFLAERALEKYENVHFRNAKGNHDKTAALVLDEALKAFYSNEPRLQVYDSPKPVFIHRWKSCLFATTHGDAPKPDRVPPVMAYDAPGDWAKSTHRYAHHGHYHQKSYRVFQDIGVDVECHSAPTAMDAWAVEQGYRCTRELKGIIYHATDGEKWRYIQRIT